MSDIGANLSRVRERIADAARRSGRDPASVRIVSVSKMVTAEVIRKAAAAGADILGESYAQEARAKLDQLEDLEVEWHFIGRLQTNKAKDVVGRYALVHSLDRLKLAKELNKRAKAGSLKLPVLIQVNLSGEESKAGVAKASALELVRAADEMDHLEVKGLMTMPPFFEQPDKARPFFAGLRRLADQLREATGLDLPELSMGMSGDFEAAVEEGATLVRVGTAIFGKRPT